VPCHTTASGIGVSMGHLDLTTAAMAYQNLVNAAAAGPACAGKGARVVPGAPEKSLLYQKVDPTAESPCGNKMPYGGPPLEKADADAVAAWIKAGAKNN